MSRSTFEGLKNIDAYDSDGAVDPKSESQDKGQDQGARLNVIHAPLNTTRRLMMVSEREKMLGGELYDPFDPELVAARILARDLCQDLNATRESDQEKRRSLLRELFGEGGDSVWMQPPFYCDYGKNIRLGQRVFFNFNCVVLDVCQVTIGDFTLFGPAVQIYTATHPLDAELRRRQEFAKPIEIGSDVWVGGGAVICPGVTIGSKTVIGAGSVVTKDIPAGVVAAGNPCRIIRDL
jgi:maltose O-acetyltransferase